jgi:hypothetical protein
VTTPELILIISRLSVGAFATFLAIFLWNHTRDIAWMFIILGTILRYGETMYRTFEVFGFIPDKLYSIGQVPAAEIALFNFPTLCIIIGFIVMIRRKSR